MQGWTDSTTALTGNSVFTTASRAPGTNSPYNFFNVGAFADQAGSFQVQQSLDNGVTWQNVGASVAVTANTYVTSKTPMMGYAPIYQVIYTNGAVTQTLFRLSSSFSEV